MSRDLFHCENASHLESLPPSFCDFKKRRDFIREFSFAIPNQDAIDAIAALSPIVEFGSGTGYWASLIKKAGTDIVCVERCNGESWGGQDIGRYHPAKPVEGLGLCYLYNRNAFLCWPPLNDDLALRVAMRVRPGRFLAFVGEGMWGCTASNEFFEYLEHAFTEVSEIAIPQWDGIHDFLGIYRKRCNGG